MPEGFKHSYKTDQREELSLVVYNVGFQKCAPGYGWGPGARDHYLLHYVLSGRGRYECNGKTFELEAGEAFLAYPDMPILYSADQTDPWEYYWVGFSGPAAPLLLARTLFTPQCPVVRPGAGEQLRQGLLDIYKARGADYAHAVRMAGYLQTVLGGLMEGAFQPMQASLASYAHRAAALLQQNYALSVSVDEIARQVGVSRSYLYRAFQSQFGCSPSTYLTRYRIQRAKQLLRHSGWTVSVIASSSGFEDPLYFSRVFHKATGLSPTEYRKKGNKYKKTANKEETNT